MIRLPGYCSLDLYAAGPIYAGYPTRLELPDARRQNGTTPTSDAAEYRNRLDRLFADGAERGALAPLHAMANWGTKGGTLAIRSVADFDSGGCEVMHTAVGGQGLVMSGDVGTIDISGGYSLDVNFVWFCEAASPTVRVLLNYDSDSTFRNYLTYADAKLRYPQIGTGTIAAIADPHSLIPPAESTVSYDCLRYWPERSRFVCVVDDRVLLSDSATATDWTIVRLTASLSPGLTDGCCMALGVKGLVTPWLLLSSLSGSGPYSGSVTGFNPFGTYPSAWSGSLVVDGAAAAKDARCAALGYAPDVSQWIYVTESGKVYTCPEPSAGGWTLRNVAFSGSSQVFTISGPTRPRIAPDGTIMGLLRADTGASGSPNYEYAFIFSNDFGATWEVVKTAAQNFLWGGRRAYLVEGNTVFRSRPLTRSAATGV